MIGNIFAFADSSVISNTITMGTNSNVSHVAVVVDTIKNDFLIIEAAQFGGRSYVGATLLSHRVKQFKENNGKIWELELSGISQNILSERLGDFKYFLYSQLNKDYDLFGAIGAGVDIFDGFGAESKENSDKLFCSELISFAFKEVGILSEGINASEVTPIDLCRFHIYEDCIQIMGEPEDIPGFNSVLLKGEDNA